MPSWAEPPGGSRDPDKAPSQVCAPFRGRWGLGGGGGGGDGEGGGGGGWGGSGGGGGELVGGGGGSGLGGASGGEGGGPGGGGGLGGGGGGGEGQHSKVRSASVQLPLVASYSHMWYPVASETR